MQVDAPRRTFLGSHGFVCLVLFALAFAVRAVGLGFGLGAMAAASPRLDRILQPVLDFMQTVPAFAYLIPLLVLFGFGPVVGLIASIIFSIPPNEYPPCPTNNLDF